MPTGRPHRTASRARAAIVAALATIALLVAAAPAAHGAAAVSGVWVVPGNNRLTVTWEPAAGNTAYRVYRSTTSGSLGSLVATVPTTSTSWVDTTATNGTSYYYTVRGWDGAVESGDPPATFVDTGADFSEGRWWNDCAGDLNGRIFMFGGYRGTTNDSNVIYTYDVVSNTTSNSPYTLPSDMYWCGAERIDGRIYLGGGGSGTNGATLFNAIRRFNPASGLTAMNATMPTARYQLAATPLADGRMMFLGGQSGSTLHPHVVPYDPAADPPGALTSALSLSGYPNGGISSPAASHIDGSSFISGGESGDLEPTNLQRRIDVSFGPDSFTEAIPANLSTNLLGAGTTSLNDKVWIIGGATSCSFLSCTLTNAILTYDQRANSVSTFGTTSLVKIYRSTAIRVKGFIYVLGGNTGNTSSNLVPGSFNTNIYRFDPGGQARGTPGAPQFATAPSAPTTAAGNKRATISWTAGSYVDRYRVFRSTVSGQLGSLIEEQAGAQDAPGTSIVDRDLTNGTTYYYTITAVGYDGRESAPTAQVSVTPYAPAPPTTLTQFRNDGSTAIPTGAVTLDGMTNDVVLRFDVSHPYAGHTLTPWVELSPTATFTRECGESAAGATFSGTPVAAPLASTNYPASVQVTGLAAGTTWYWRACSVDDEGVEGDWAVRGGAPDFRTNAAPTATPTSPANDAWVGSGEQTLVAQHGDADAHTGRIAFEVCSTNAADPWSSTCGSSYQSWNSAPGLANGATASYSPYRPLAEGDAYWRVRSTDSLGTTGSWTVRRVRVDLTPPTPPTNVALTSKGAGQLDLTWSASTDGGSGGITYDVEHSTDGTAWTATCTNIAVLVCSRTGLAANTALVMRVRACDLVDNCSPWQGRAASSAGLYNLRSTLNSAQLTSTNNRRATTAAGTNNTNTSVTHGNTLGWFPIRPAVAASTTNVGAGEPANTPYTNPAGTGWVIDDTAGRSIAPGDIQVRMTVNSSSATGVGDIQCRAYRVTASAGSITSFTLLGKATVGVDVLSGTASTLRTCTPATLASQLQLAAGESIYVELWLRVTTAGAAGASIALHVEGSSSSIAIPPPGTPPNMPALVAPANGASTTNQPTLQATYSHPVPNSGFLEFEAATTAGFGGTILQAGTSALRANGQDGTLALSPLAWATTHHWRARAVDVNGLASGWSGTRTFTTTSAPSRPTNSSPSDGATTTSLSPTLTSSAFSDPDVTDTHQASQWQVVVEGQPWASPLADSGVTASDLTSWTTPLLTLGERYAWRVRHRDSQGQWSQWSIPTLMVASTSSMSLSIDESLLDLGGALPGTNLFATFVTTVTTSNATGYYLEATGTAAGTAGAGCSGCPNPLLDWTGTDTTPTSWGSQSGFLGVTVRDAQGGRLAKWGPGTGTAEQDVAANRYAGVSDSAPLVLHWRNSPVTDDDVVVTVRMRPSDTTSPGDHDESITITALPNP